MKRLALFALIVLGGMNGDAQSVTDLPITTFNTKEEDTTKPIVIYLSGDGGLNAFSKSFAQEFSNNGYPVVVLNSQKYFWSKKTPAQAATDISRIMHAYKNVWRRNKVLFVAYSFGADVAPFVYNKLSADHQRSINNIVLLSPSPMTDFEIHLTQMFGRKQEGGMSVTNEINKISSIPILVLQGEKETEKVEASAITTKNARVVILPGGHRYDNNTSGIVSVLMKNIKS